MYSDTSQKFKHHFAVMSLLDLGRFYAQLYSTNTWAKTNRNVFGGTPPIHQLRLAFSKATILVITEV